MLDDLKSYIQRRFEAFGTAVKARLEPLEDRADEAEAGIAALQKDLGEVKSFVDALKSGKFDDDPDMGALLGGKAKVAGVEGGPKGGLPPVPEGSAPAAADPAKAGAAAAAKARAEGTDPVAEAAKAAHAEAKGGGMTDLEANKAAADAAKAEGAGDPEAARAASNAAMAPAA